MVTYHKLPIETELSMSVQEALLPGIARVLEIKEELHSAEDEEVKKALLLQAVELLFETVGNNVEHQTELVASLEGEEQGWYEVWLAELLLSNKLEALCLQKKYHQSVYFILKDILAIADHYTTILEYPGLSMSAKEFSQGVD